MNAESYEEMVARLFASRSHGVDGLVHAAMGIAGEAGELLDAVKKTWVYGKPLDLDNVIEELGDLEFYLQAMRQLLDVTRGEVLAENRRKLYARYPSGYSHADAIARRDKAAA